MFALLRRAMQGAQPARPASTASRQRDAMAFVKQELREKNYAITHRDDLFGADETEAWDAAEEWMHRLASSPEAQAFEKEFVESFKTDVRTAMRERQAKHAEVDARYAAAMQAWDETIAARQAEFDAAMAERAAASEAKARERSIAAKAEATRASLALRDARQEKRAAHEKFTVERRSLASVSKPFVFNQVHWLGRPLRYDDAPVMLSASHRFLEIANDYYGVQAKLRIPVTWRVCAIPKDVPAPPRQGSQMWHRDQTDSQILKLFIYYTDVAPSNGALEYVKDSLPQNSRWSEEIPLTTKSGYPPGGTVERLVPKSEIVSCSGRRGTLVFVDTAGLHRGGYATSGIRITSQATFLRPGLATPLLKPGAADARLTPEQVYAFS